MTQSWLHGFGLCEKFAIRHLFPMKTLRRLTLAEQTAEHLRDGLRHGRWSGKLPGVLRLAQELGVSKLNVRTALRLLEMEGWLETNGPGRSRLIQNVNSAKPTTKQLRFGILLNQRLGDENAKMQQTLLQIKQTIETAGHECVFSSESQSRLKGDVKRIAKLVESTPVDAWIVLAGPHELLHWFSQQPFPTYALGGGVHGLRMASAGTNIQEAQSKAVSHLIAMGHRRIVMICPKYWRKPHPGKIVTILREQLEEVGTSVSDYHLPDWEETPEGLQALLHSLFRITPPTTLLVVEPAHAVAVQAFLASRNLQVGRDVSLVCMIDDPALAWQRPSIAHYQVNDEVHIRHILRWVNSIERGCPDLGQKFTEAEFILGETIAPPTRN